MTNQHQLQHEYTFTPRELQYLQTTQRLALERVENLSVSRKLTEDELQIRKATAMIMPYRVRPMPNCFGAG